RNALLPTCGRRPQKGRTSGGVLGGAPKSFRTKPVKLPKSSETSEVWSAGSKPPRAVAAGAQEGPAPPAENAGAQEGTPAPTGAPAQVSDGLSSAAGSCRPRSARPDVRGGGADDGGASPPRPPRPRQRRPPRGRSVTRGGRFRRARAVPHP